MTLLLMTLQSPTVKIGVLRPSTRRFANSPETQYRDLRDLERQSNKWTLDFPDPEDAFMAILAKDTDLKGLRKELHEHAHEMEPFLVDILETDWTAQNITEATKIRQQVNITMHRFMESYDLVLTPTLAVPPFSVESSGPSEIEGRSVGAFHWLSFTYPINLTGQPAATVPANWNDDGLPIGLQIIGKHLADETVLAASAAYEQSCPWQNQYFPLEN